MPLAHFFDSFLVFGLPPTNLFVFPFIFPSLSVFLWPSVSLSATV